MVSAGPVAVCGSGKPGSGIPNAVAVERGDNGTEGGFAAVGDGGRRPIATVGAEPEGSRSGDDGRDRRGPGVKETGLDGGLGGG